MLCLLSVYPVFRTALVHLYTSTPTSGIDICTFSILTLLFRVSEKIATPTSVVLMALNTLLGFIYRQLVMGGVEPAAVRFFTVCVPVVVVGEFPLVNGHAVVVSRDLVDYTVYFLCVYYV